MSAAPGLAPVSTPVPTPVPVRVGPVARVVLALIRIYQWLRAGRPSPCRYIPTCSEYAAEAVARHGTAKGGLMAVRRVAHCHPWGGQGFDPVPEGGRR